MSATTQSPQPTKDIVRDVFLWKNKKLSLSVLFISTVLWVLLEVYQFNFITLLSWVAMSVVIILFFWGNMYRIFGREAPSMSRLHVAEDSAISLGNSIREWMEEGVRWMFRVGAEGEWYVFAGAVAGLLMLSFLGSLFDLLTLSYIGILLGMTVPVIYERYEDKIKEWVQRMKLQSRKLYNIINERLFKRKKKEVVHDDKERKAVHDSKEEKVE